jgi:hypothetical protein
MAKLEFLRLTQWGTGDPVFLDASEIAFIQQLAACDKYARRTRVVTLDGRDHFLVSEEATEIALRSGRGFAGINEPEISLVTP